MCMSVLSHVFNPCETGEDIGSPRIGEKDSCEQSYRFWEKNLGPLQEQQVFFIAEPSL